MNKEDKMTALMIDKARKMTDLHRARTRINEDPEDFMKALRFADYHHRNQVRKYTFMPYITHPIAVARKVSELIGKIAYVTDKTVAAALLHDVVGDCDVTNQDIADIFGTAMAAVVADLTDPDKVEGVNRAARNVIIRNRYQNDACLEACIIKLCDLWHNHISIEKYDPKLAKQYNIEREELEAVSPMKLVKSMILERAPHFFDVPLEFQYHKDRG